MHERGVTPVLAVVLLVGITAAGSMALFVVGTSLIGGSQEEVRSTQVERSMVTLADSTDDLKAGKRTNASFAFAGTGGTRPTVRPAAGRLNITHYVDGSPETVVVDDRSLGALSYQRDGVEYAYQGGGVWRRSDRGQTQLLRNPSVRYGDGMLSFSFVNITGERGLGSESGIVSVTESTDRFPTSTLTNPLENGTVLVEIESRYCSGWERHFRRQTAGAITESCTETGETTTGELQVELIVPFEFDDGTSHTIIANNINPSPNPNHGIHGSTKVGHDYPSASNLVERKISACANGAGTTMTGATVSQPGLHCVGSLDKTTSYTIDTTSGDVTLAVDGAVNPGGLDIHGTGTVTILANGPVFDNVAGGYRIGESGKAEQLRIFVHSDYDVGASGWGGTNVSAFLYAPEATFDMDGGGNPNFKGSVIVDDFQINGASNIYHDPDTADIEFTFEAGGKALYYLHVDETTVAFSDRQ
jgi:hypothetical protein